MGLTMLAASALTLGKLGLVGRFLDVVCIYLAGSWSILVPILFGYAAVYMMIRRSAFPWHSRHMGLLILFVTFLAAMEISFYGDVEPAYQSTWPLLAAQMNAITALREQVTNPALQPNVELKAGGGLIGYALFAVLHYLFSSWGTGVVLIFAALIGAALFTEKSLVAGFQRGTRFVERGLDRLWAGSKQYATLLFGPERKKPAAEDAEAETETPPRKGRRRPQLIVDGEIYDASGPVVESAVEPAVEHPTPIVHDFAAHLRAKHAEEVERAQPATDQHLEQVGNQIIMRYPERVKPKSEGRSDKGGEMPAYTVGPTVHDENYRLPPLSLFNLPDAPAVGFSQKSAQENARKLEMTLESFGVQAKVLEISRGPTVTRYEVQPAVGVKVSRIVNLTDDIALALAARDIRMEAPIPGKSVIGIEVPNAEVAIVTLREVLESPEFQAAESKLSIALGRDISGSAIVGNLQKMPHLLVAGATGSGKSVCINGIIASILMNAKPHEVKLMMIDPKMVELSGYNGIPHLLAPVVTDPRKAAFALKKVVQEMENRYQLFAERGARDIERYNQLLKADGLDELPYIVVIVDELADLMMVAPGDVEDAICRIAQMARAAGIHLIVATQRPSVDVITGVIKANIPSRIAFAVSSMADSRTILDSGGAEKLLGRGDMLYLPVGASKSVRVQGAFVSEQEIERLVEYVKAQQNAVYTVDLQTDDEENQSPGESDLDALFVDAVDLVLDSGQASVSMLQRRFRIGYSRAARIVDQMELQGFVGRFEGSKPREVLISREQWQAVKNSFMS